MNPPLFLHDFFSYSVKTFPHRIALDIPPSSVRHVRRTLTYSELDLRAGSLAGAIRNHISGECVVAVFLPKTTEHLYVAQLAILFAGGAYVCIDPSFPDHQIATILQDAQPTAVLSDPAGLLRLRQMEGIPFPLLDVTQQSNLDPEPFTPPWLTSHHLAYVIYTSGTTGKPKGVMIEHRAIVNLIQGDIEAFDTQPEDRITQNSSCAYDSSVEEIWMAFASGATLVVMDDEANRLGPDLIGWLNDERITIFCPPPTLLRATSCTDPDKSLPFLRRVHVGGEALPQDIADRWALGRMLINDYGPTECSVVALRSNVHPGREVTIGTPVAGMFAWVVDEQLNELPDGVVGELCLAGAGLARGYLNDLELTSKKFVLHPRLGRIYRTGDLAFRTSSGEFVCQGRIDTQVKIRGYRIELEAVESALVGCEGVRASVCCVQGEAGQQQIIAFIVPMDPANPPSFDAIRTDLLEELPSYAVPSHFGYLATIPTSVSGKLDRRKLPILEFHTESESETVLQPANQTQAAILDVFRQVLQIREPFSVQHDFFRDLGGDSLRAAMVISLLRKDPRTSSLTVRDLYDGRTVQGLAARLSPIQFPTTKQSATSSGIRMPVLATLIQTICLLSGLVLSSAVLYLVAFQGVPWLLTDIGLLPSLLSAPLVFLGLFVGYILTTTTFAVGLKWLLIGKYRRMRVPVWGEFYVRNWIVSQAVRLIPWRLIDHSVFQNAILRLLGAKIGNRVHIHRGVNLFRGGWDLLDLGDDVTLCRDAGVLIVEFDRGDMVFAPVQVGAASTIEIRASLSGGSRMGSNSVLSAQSAVFSGTSIPSGECWSGVPAIPCGSAPAAPVLDLGEQNLSPTAHGLCLLAARLLLSAGSLLPWMIGAYAFSLWMDVDTADVIAWVDHPSLGIWGCLLSLVVVCLSVPVSLIANGLMMRTLGRIPSGTMSRWSWDYLRVTLKTDILESSNEWLSGTLLYPIWLRAVGMRIGQNSEFSTIFDTVPELVEVGCDSFLADGIYLAGPQIHRGTVRVQHTRLGDHVFLGNYSVIPVGVEIPNNVLIGVCTVADGDPLVAGTSWFGHPRFELPRREIVSMEAGLTHRPSWIRYLNRCFWEYLRFTLPIPPTFLVLLWFSVIGSLDTHFSLGVVMFGIVPLVDLCVLAALLSLGLIVKWALLGKVQPSIHPLWSCWCSRWDFNYTAWHYWVQGPLANMEGTLWVNVYLRLLGVKIGKHVVIADPFALVVDPDMIECADGATVNALIQAHTFEDRVLKIDRVRIGERSTVSHGVLLLYGAEIGADSRVLSNSVVMKHEHLREGHTYAGFPTRSVGECSE